MSELAEGRLGDRASVLGSYARVAIVGGPRTGKTTLSLEVTDRPVFHTDDTKGLPWSDQPAIWLERVGTEPRFLIEGVQVARCLRKGLQVDAIVYLSVPYRALTPGQEALHKGVGSVFRDYLGMERGIVPVFYW